MISYKIVVEDMHCNNCVKKLREAFTNKSADAAVNANLSRHELIVESDLSVEEIYDTIEEAGFTPSDLELM